jgi:hypothetical protein
MKTEINKTGKDSANGVELRSNGGKTYFNQGCAFSIYKPEIEEEILAYLNKNYGDVHLHKVCCRHNPQLEMGAHIITVCAGCDRRFSHLHEGITTSSLWEVIDKLDNFPFPDHDGLVVSVHDACPVRGKPEVHRAVRSLLNKMHIEIVETEFHGAQSKCCGDSFYPSLPTEIVIEQMRKRASEMPCTNVVVYCISCIKSIYIGGKNPLHLIDLLFNKPTEPQIYDTEVWHDQLQKYIDVH